MSKFQDNRKEIVENILNKIENENLRFQFFIKAPPITSPLSV